MKLTGKLLLQFVLLTMVPLTLVGFMAYKNGQDTIERNTFDHLTADDLFDAVGKLEALDAPGEWFLDAQTKTLYLWTLDGDSPAAAPLCVPPIFGASW